MLKLKWFRMPGLTRFLRSERRKISLFRQILFLRNTLAVLERRYLKALKMLKISILKAFSLLSWCACINNRISVNTPTSL